MKLALGTVQFGQDYGISNSGGIIEKKKAFQILTFAIEHGITMLDTATAYGKSESVIGSFHNERNVSFDIISKVPHGTEDKLTDTVFRSLQLLGIGKFYGYLYHNFNGFLSNPESFTVLSQLKRDGTISKLGFSLYYPEEVDYILTHQLECDLVQVPYSVLDRRFETYFPLLKSSGVEIHVRSAFLQGLVFKQPESLANYFSSIKNKIEQLHTLAQEIGISVSNLCLAFVLKNRFIDKVVVGVDNLENLRDNLRSFEYVDILGQYLDVLEGLKVNDENIVVPSRWKLE